MKWIICLFNGHVPKKFTRTIWTNVPGGPMLPVEVPVTRCTRCLKEL